MWSNSVTIKFIAKLDDFAGGKGYKVPKLKARHVTISERDTLGILFMSGLEHEDITKARLKKYSSFNLPGVVWLDESKNEYGWTVRPIGNKFMAEVTITRPLVRD